MKFTKATNYALHTMLEIGGLDPKVTSILT